MESARATLERARTDARVPGWGYRKDTEPATEPTALAGLALLATGPQQTRSVHQAGKWLAALQQPDGSVGVSASIRQPGWPTALAVLLWTAQGRHETPRERAIRWLLQRKGRTGVKEPDSPAKHDPSISAWPWVSGTQSWIEPTAMAMLALAAAGQGQHPRISDGLRYIHDRALPDSGWNYGNTVIFGKPLRSQPAPTGLALLALAAVERKRSPLVKQGIRYLQASLPMIRSAVSLCWGLLGLLAWDAALPEADHLLEQSLDAARAQPHAAFHAAHALLAAGGARSLELLGI